MKQDKGDFGFLYAGFASLLLVAFLDNARGPLIPVLLEKLQIPYETAGLFLTLGNLAAIGATFLLGRALRRWAERTLAIAICWLAALPGLLAPFVDGRTSLLLLGLILGAIVALLGSLCSILTIKGSPAHAKGRYLSFQQVMYGVGSLTAPLVFSALLQRHIAWWWLLVIGSLALFALGLSLLFVLPRHPSAPLAEASPLSPDRPSGAISRGGLVLVTMFAFYVGGEVLASMWMSSLLVDRHALSPAAAAQLLMVFFILLALTRFLCFLLMRPRFEVPVIIGCLLSGIVLGILGQQGQSWALPAMGILGPFFPLCMARISVQFPDNWQQMMIYVYTGMQIMLAIMHLSVGKVADTFGIEKAFLLSPAFLLVALLLLTPSLRQKSSAIPIS